VPVVNAGYRRWQGTRRGRLGRWLIMARAGIAVTGRSRWLWRFVLLAWLPLLYYGVAFFAVGQLTETRTLDAARDMWQFQLMRGTFGGELAERFLADPTSHRPAIWAALIHLFMHYTQIFCVMIVVAIVGPRLVSEDLRSRALALYLARPITRLDYVVGKLAVVCFWVGTVTLLPALVLYALSIVFSPSLDALTQTIGVLPRVVAVSLLLMVGTGAPMLALSSLAPNPRFLAFLWAGAWVFSSVVSRVLSTALYPGTRDGDWTGLTSVSANFDAVAFRVFDIEALLRPSAEHSVRLTRILERLSHGHDWTWSLALVLGVAALSLVVVAVRVGRPGEAGAR
jgi:ABC-type transport system involved in multi-copper enzyme maturation permease subunit